MFYGKLVSFQFLVSNQGYGFWGEPTKDTVSREAGLYLRAFAGRERLMRAYYFSYPIFVFFFIKSLLRKHYTSVLIPAPSCSHTLTSSGGVCFLLSRLYREPLTTLLKKLSYRPHISNNTLLFIYLFIINSITCLDHHARDGSDGHVQCGKLGLVYRVSWLFLLLSPYKLKSPWEEGSSGEECLHQVGLWPCLWSIFLIANWSGRTKPNMGGINPRQVDMGYRRKQTERVPANGVPLLSLLQFLLPSPSLGSCPDFSQG